MARETILGGTLQPASTADFSRYDTRKNGDAASRCNTDGHVTTKGGMPEPGGDSQKVEDDTPQRTSGGDTTMAGPEPDAAKLDGPAPETQVTPAPDASAPELTRPDVPTASADEIQRPSTSSGWFAWFSKTPAVRDALPSAEPTPVEQSRDAEMEQSSQPHKAVSDDKTTPAPQPIPQPVSQPAPQPAPEPASQLASQPASQSATQPALPTASWYELYTLLYILLIANHVALTNIWPSQGFLSGQVRLLSR